MLCLVLNTGVELGRHKDGSDSVTIFGELGERGTYAARLPWDREGGTIRGCCDFPEVFFITTPFFFPKLWLLSKRTRLVSHASLNHAHTLTFAQNTLDPLIISCLRHQNPDFPLLRYLAFLTLAVEL